MDGTGNNDFWRNRGYFAVEINSLFKLSFSMVVFIRRYIIQFLTLVVAGVWLAIFQLPDSNLHIVACDVGQGDAILILKGSVQILTDGGPNKKVLDCLSEYIPFWDREIELVVSTHPDADHSTGLIDVVKRYNVGTFLANDLDVSTQVWQALKKEVGSAGVRVLHPTNGLKLRLGLIYLDILHPPEGFESAKTNEYSIVYVLKYGDFEGIFTGDINQMISDQLSVNSEIGTVDYIKVPHHGSKNGLTENLLKVLKPKIAVISVGKNSYGHPHEEILQMLKNSNAKLLRTDLKGDVRIATDGKEYWIY